MAKLTLTFKGKMLQSQPLIDGTFTIGRDEANDLQIDSLAVAPRHATVTVIGTDKIVRQVDPNYPLIVNGEPVNEHHLKNGDRIGVGKHQIFFSDTERPQAAPGLPLVPPIRHDTHEEEGEEITPFKHGGMMEASLQVLRGKNIGVVIPLRRAMTRLGTENSGSAVIVHRKEGYFLSALVAVNNVKINGIDIQEESVQLNHGDILKVGPNTLQFFCKGEGEHPAKADAEHREHQPD